MPQARPFWLKIVAWVAFVWNLLGMLAFFGQVLMSDEMLSELPPDQQELYRTIPVWATVGFAAAVFGGVIGSLGLGLGKRWATIPLIVSLAGVVVQQSHMYLFSNTMEVMGAASAVFPTIVLVIAVALVWLSITATQKNWHT